MPDELGGDFVLGIDLGSNSLGWALIKLVDDNPVGLIRAGVRVFEAGMEGDLESGQEESRNKARRDARLHRRQLWRRARRLTKTFNLLRRFGLLPTNDASTPERRQHAINNLDEAIRISDWFKSRKASGRYPEPEQTFPYILRAAALDEPLGPHFLGRALYHLAQRRGFLSGRLKPAKSQEEEGMVKGGIKTLREKMKEQSARTLGEYLSLSHPSQKRIRGPGHWTARDMYEHEFEQIWAAQMPHHPGLLTENRKEELRKTIFYQRPLWFDRNTIGQCGIEPGERRAPMYRLDSQRFRLLQTVNNLRLLPPGETEKHLTSRDRGLLVAALELKDELTLTQVRKLLSLPKDYKFKGEAEGEKRIIGDRTSAAFYEVFGERWLETGPEERDHAVEYVHGFQRADKLAQAAKKKWSLEHEAAEKLSEISLEPDYLNVSRKAIQNLLPLLEQGLTFMEARKRAYPESFDSGAALPFLPPLALKETQRRIGAIRNPAVQRSLTELRKVVNAVIRQFGKPTYVRIELARELKKPRRVREAISRKNRENEAARSGAIERIKAITGDPYPSRDDIRRVQLFDECHGHCVYCGNPIAGRNFLGRESQVDVDHIIPFSMSLDDSYMSLVICHAACNRGKGDRTPFRAFSGEADRYERILELVRKFTGDRRTVAEKLKRFQMNDEALGKFLEDFRNRQLNDTAYASRLAAQYLGLLYGGVDDSEHRKRVQASSGQATAHFRRLWNLNSILGDGPTTNGGRVPKSRADHRHHAVDGVVIALTNTAMIKQLSDAAQRAPLEHRRRFASLEAPWLNFADSVRAEIGRIVVSHRVSKKVSGALHKETNYSSKEYGVNTRRHRVMLTDLSQKDVMSESVIVDRGVRELVREKLVSLGGGEPKKVFAVPENLPCFVTADSRRIPIKKVRIQETVKTRKVGEGHRARFVKPGGNHHLEIFGEPGADGQDKKWDTLGVVSMLDAYERLRKREPIVRKHSEPPWQFRFSVSSGETLAFDDGPFKGELLVVRTISEEEKTGSVKIEMAPINDARQKGEIRKSNQWITKSPNELRKWQARKVVVSPLGEVSKARD
jgi:CRISPR-associated endonuclease Csn1